MYGEFQVTAIQHMHAVHQKFQADHQLNLKRKEWDGKSISAQNMLLVENESKRSRCDSEVDESSVEEPISINKALAKKVRFHGKVKVVLVPSLQEYKQANLDNLLWWNSSDYAYFKDTVINDLRKCLKLNSHLDARSALSLLCDEEETLFSHISNIRMKSNDEPILYESPVSCR